MVPISGAGFWSASLAFGYSQDSETDLSRSDSVLSLLSCPVSSGAIPLMKCYLESATALNIEVKAKLSPTIAAAGHHMSHQVEMQHKLAHVTAVSSV